MNGNIFMIYVFPALLIAVIAGVLAFLLAYLGKKLAVKKDERIDKVKDCLAGANCGGCGYAGCSAFAEALVNGETTLDKCSATDVESKTEIAKTLGVEVGDTNRTVAVVHCMGGDACGVKYNYQGYYSCESEALLVGGNKACAFGCLGLGTCKSACPYDAISIESGVARVDYKKCRSCGACVVKCPKLLIDRIPATAKVYVACSSHCKGKDVMGACKKGCIGCTKCAKVCPNGAITMQENLPVIDYSKCTGCGLCKDSCPRKCILPFPAEK
jgi:Na+-translocating ferredoxin:NAD+ oxidoreductase RNF subunit RnfB